MFSVTLIKHLSGDDRRKVTSFKCRHTCFISWDHFSFRKGLGLFSVFFQMLDLAAFEGWIGAIVGQSKYLCMRNASVMGKKLYKVRIVVIGITISK